jgi:hypothetical protein
MFNLVIERYFYIISLQEKTNAISDLLIKNISKYYNLKLYRLFNMIGEVRFIPHLCCIAIQH